ncbi:MAG: hypothetical protein IT564_12055 [Rhodospirillales bacterium]|nr:hypothetical protein [Rhodospirillales bacterium]
MRYSMSEPSDLRAELIASGVLRPGPELELRPVRLPADVAVLRLDGLGRRAAARHVAEGRGRIGRMDDRQERRW